LDHLNRAQAHLPESIWERIDAAAVAASSALLTGRRFLEVEGPFGPGLTAIEPGADDYCRAPGEGEAGAIVSRAIAVPMLRKSCQLSARRLAGHPEKDMPLNLAEVEDAAEAVTRWEEEFIYFGQTDFGLEGLLTGSGHRQVKGAGWSSLDAALDKPVVVDNHTGSVVLGQDLRVGYAGFDGIHYQLFVCESMVLRLDEPGAVCVVTD